MDHLGPVPGPLPRLRSALTKAVDRPFRGGVARVCRPWADVFEPPPWACQLDRAFVIDQCPWAGERGRRPLAPPRPRAPGRFARAGGATMALARCANRPGPRTHPPY